MTHSRLRYWFLPCWCGDFRLEPNKSDDTGCILTVVDPTDADKAMLAPFLTAARERNWIDSTLGLAPTGKTTLYIQAPMLEAGPLLAARALPEGERWTAVRGEGGEIVLGDGTGEGLLERLKNGIIAVKNGIGELLTAEAVVTVTAPARGCPPPAPALSRASEVLGAFSTRRQMQSFEQRRFMVAFGCDTGKAYRIFHRNEAALRGMGHTIVEDVERGTEVCAWDDTVPAEEEVLKLKLAVEKRERWLLGLA